MSWLNVKGKKLWSDRKRARVHAPVAPCTNFVYGVTGPCTRMEMAEWKHILQSSILTKWSLWIYPWVQVEAKIQSLPILDISYKTLRLKQVKRFTKYCSKSQNDTHWSSKAQIANTLQVPPTAVIALHFLSLLVNSYKFLMLQQVMSTKECSKSQNFTLWSS